MGHTLVCAVWDRARRRVDRRLNRFDGILIRIDVPGLALDDGGGLAASDDRIARGALQPGESGSGKLNGVSQHRVRVAAKDAGEAKVLDALVGEAEDDLAFVRADVFDVVKVSRRHEKHFTGGDGEAFARAMGAGNGYQVLAAQAIREFVSVGVPVRLADAARRKQQPPNREALEDGEIVGVKLRDAAEFVDKAWRSFRQRGGTNRRGCFLSWWSGKSLRGHLVLSLTSDTFRRSVTSCLSAYRFCGARTSGSTHAQRVSLNLACA